MKVACDRCLKIVSEDSIEFINDWTGIPIGNGSKYLFCKKCADVFWKTMFNCDEKDGNSDGACVEAIPVSHGHWVSINPDEDGYAFEYVCSVCKRNIIVDYYGTDCDYDYCPNCGSKMDEEDDEQDEMGRN